MSDYEPITVRQWVDVIRRARLGRAAKEVALMMASYADSDGSRVFPGVAVLAVGCEMTYNTAQAAVAKLRSVGLIELVKRGSGRSKRHADEYRLILHEDVLDLVEVLNPVEFKAAADTIGKKKRGRPRGPLHPSDRGANENSQRVDNRPLHPTEEGANTDPTTVDNFLCTPVIGVQPDSLHPSNRTLCTPVERRPPSTTTVTDKKTATHNSIAVSTEPIPGDSGRDDPEISDSDEPLPDRCAHRQRARIRADGTSSCALCRRNTSNLRAV